MVYQWEIEVNGKTNFQFAVHSWTAISRCLDKTNLEGVIKFKRLQKMNKITCEDCGHKYYDNPESKKHHMEKY